MKARAKAAEVKKTESIKLEDNEPKAKPEPATVPKPESEVKEKEPVEKTDDKPVDQEVENA
jgi:hypothetical protein